MPPVADPISNNKSHHTTRNIQESGDDCHGESFQDAFFILPSAHRRVIGVRLFNREGLDAFEDMGEDLVNACDAFRPHLIFSFQNVPASLRFHEARAPQPLHLTSLDRVLQGGSALSWPNECGCHLARPAHKPPRIGLNCVRRNIPTNY